MLEEKRGYSKYWGHVAQISKQARIRLAGKRPDGAAHAVEPKAACLHAQILVRFTRGQKDRSDEGETYERELESTQKKEALEAEKAKD